MKTAVIPIRNDNYGMFLAERTIQCLNSMIDVFDEIIVVDWNSPHDVSLLDQIKEYIEPSGKIRNIVVSKDFVETNMKCAAQPCCEVMARNIGVRRATGEWVVSTNCDIIATPFSLAGLSETTMYTARKYCVEEHIHLTHLFSMTTKDKIDLLKTNKHKFNRMMLCSDSPHHRDDKYSLCTGCGDFQMAHKNVWCAVRGFEEALKGRNYADSNILGKVFSLSGFSTDIFEVDLFHLNHDSRPQYRKQLEKTHMNNKEDAFVRYILTENNDSWGFSDIEFPETRI